MKDAYYKARLSRAILLGEYDETLRVSGRWRRAGYYRRLWKRCPYDKAFTKAKKAIMSTVYPKHAPPIDMSRAARKMAQVLASNSFKRIAGGKETFYA